MKIEKLNENQIRCTLTREDLISRHLKISELAYGSEKTQGLFREMIAQAGLEVGFEAENMPLMIEAIPMNSDCIVLVITKIEDPEELDTRFSRFAPSSAHNFDPSEEDMDEAEDLEELFPSVAPSVPKGPSFEEMLQNTLAGESDKNCFLFRFDTLNRVMDLAAQSDWYDGTSVLYKDNDHGEYLLALSRGVESKEQFQQMCSLASEYGTGRSISAAGDSFLAEHCEILIAEDALFKLG